MDERRGERIKLKWASFVYLSRWDDQFNAKLLIGVIIYSAGAGDGYIDGSEDELMRVIYSTRV